MRIFDGFNDLFLLSINIFLGARWGIGINNVRLSWERIRRNKGRGTLHAEAIRKALQQGPIIKLNAVFAMTDSSRNIPKKPLANATPFAISSPKVPEMRQPASSRFGARGPAASGIEK
jgi:hypothetical protein